MAGNMALAFGALMGGAIVLTYGGKSLKGAFAAGSTGSAPAAPATAATSDAAAATAVADNPSAAGSYGLITQADLKAVGAQHGWTGAEIDSWLAVIKLESNGTLTDTNSSSGAYGIAQFIDGSGEYAKYGGNSTTVIGQLTAMANYISQRYGNPSAALYFHLAHNWY
jgi:hypothetical protein